MIERTEVGSVAELARLDLTDAEIDRLTHDLEVVLRHFEAIRDLGESEHRPGFEPPMEPSGPRDDHPAPLKLGLAPADLAPVWRDGFFLVPRPSALQDPTDPARSPEL